MTTDLFLTLHLLDCFPDLRLTADISHYVVGREFAWPISQENHALMHRILDNAWGFHGRVASREQVQIQISFPHHKDWVDLFMGWWQYGMRSWRRRAPSDATVTFLCELGPKEYAITGPDGYELSFGDGRGGGLLLEIFGGSRRYEPQLRKGGRSVTIKNSGREPFGYNGIEFLGWVTARH